jgi:hypothetical protein
MALGKNSIALLAHLAAVKEFCLYCCSVTYTLFLIRNSGVLDSGSGVLAKASLIQCVVCGGRGCECIVLAESGICMVS